MSEGADWPARYAELLEQWRDVPDIDSRASIASIATLSWPSAFAAMQQQQADLRAQGLWLAGPADLLSLVGLQRWELAHSAALGWLLDPEGSHGLGDALLRFVLDAAGPLPRELTPVQVQLETGLTRSRADVVVVGQGWTLVVEVKIDAVEQPEQVYRLWQDWQDAPEPRFVFLTPTGQRPTTAMQQDCDDDWVAMSWRAISAELGRVVADCESPGPAFAATQQYLATLNRLFGRRR